MKGDLSLKKAIEEYKSIYLAYRNFAKRTREEYVNDLEDMVRFLGKMGVSQVGEVRLPHLVRYIAELEKRGFAGSTRKRKVISIRSFFSFLYLEEFTLTDIGKKIIVPYVEARKPRYLMKDEYEKLLECAKPNKRDYAIIQLLLQTGITLSELTGLTLDDLRVGEPNGNKGEGAGYIRVTSVHRNKSRVIPLNPKASSAIDDYLSIRGKSLPNALFLNRDGEGLGERGVEKVVGKYLKLAGISDASVNSLRHTFGIHHAIMGANRKIIQTVMGNRTKRSIGVYFQIADQYQLRELEADSL